MDSPLARCSNFTPEGSGVLGNRRRYFTREDHEAKAQKEIQAFKPERFRVNMEFQILQSPVLIDWS